MRGLSLSSVFSLLANSRKSSIKSRDMSDWLKTRLKKKKNKISVHGVEDQSSNYFS